MEQIITGGVMAEGKLPESYKRAAGRCVTRVDGAASVIGVAFDAADGSVIRVALPVEHAKSLAESILYYLDISQSPKSSDISSSPRSIPDDGMNVCPALLNNGEGL
ncbi:MAG: hypothetical protein ACYC09_14910 [Bacteroidota bacterium]